MIIVDFQNCFIFILVCFFSLLCYSLIFRKPKYPRLDFDLPPSPPSLPVIGHLHLLLSVLIHRSLQKLSTKYGSILYLRVFSFPVVLVSSASIAYEIFRAHDVNISSRGFPPTDDSFFAGSFSFISAPYGDYWKFMKKLLVKHLLGPHALDRSRGVRAEELDRFYKNLFDKAMNKESVDICAEALKLSNNSTCKMIMGRSCSEENGEAESVRALATEIDALTKKILLANMLRSGFRKLVLTLLRREMMDVSCRFDELLERILVEHEEKLDMHQQGTDLLDVLLAAYRDENAEHKISRNHIKSFFADLLFASTDTLVQTTQWAMAELINNPNVLERLRGEIDSVVGKIRLVQETDLPNLPYLQAVVKEVLRLHPPGPVFGRFSQEGCRVGGFYVPEKTTFMVNAYAVMRDPDSWEDPDEFKPERFLASPRSDQEKERREQAIKYISFGSGRRSCPGENLAYFFIGTAIGVMVQGFEWKIKEEKVNMDEAVVGLSLTMAHPLKITPVSRTLRSLT
ncbi:PREDICTED: cytochrome P450 705A5-like isoform X1 [Camelina sativa]|uniref:Cytochrome P450 705A5-like isoform X1 n=2 Tax=Camelina sativa TaxID=90675 RepID=A0ABM0Z010_CAMSA|nr:PREDICTED: cytochrome P450 705A5-like isoform X1 [Camelina sativa]